MSNKDLKSTASKNKEIIRNLYSELNKGNYESILNYLDENVKITVIGSLSVSGTYTGIQELSENFISVITNALEVQPKIIIDEMVAEGDYVVVKAHGEGGIAKNGKEYNNTYCYFMKLKDGKLIEETEYVDTELSRMLLED